MINHITYKRFIEWGIVLKFKMSIKNKIVFSFIGLVSIILFCQIIFNSFYATDYYTNHRSAVMEKAFYEINELYDGATQSIEDAILDYENKYNLNILIFNETGDVIYASNDRYTERELSTGPPFKSAVAFPSDRRHVDRSVTSGNPTISTTQMSPNATMLILSGSFIFDDSENFISISVPMESIENSVEVFTRASTIISVIALAIAILFSYIISKGITKPISDIERVTSHYADLDFSMYVNENVSSLELSNLAKNINSMSKQLEKAILDLNVANDKLQKDIDHERKIEQMRREFIANVSHEMKTPLALLQLYSSNLKSNVANIDKDYYCDTIIEETDKLNDMVVSMLDISSIESGLSKMDFVEISMSTLCLSVVDKFMPLLDSFKLNLNIQEGLQSLGDVKYLEQVMKNYINNAINHTEKYKEISISLYREEDYAVFEILNEGNNISENDIEYIWDSFYKSDKSRIRSDNNVGLGLYIVKTIIDKHDGICSVNNVENGVVFNFKVKCIFVL